VRFRGRYFDAEDAVVQPAAPAIPIWVGGNSNRAIRRAVELGDGWSPFPAPEAVTRFAGTDALETLVQFRDKLSYLRALAAEQGRTTPLEICTGRFGQNGQLNRGGPLEAAQAVDDYSALAEAGVTCAGFHVRAPSPSEFADNIQRFGEEVIAKVRRHQPEMTASL
jgi:alkanesulfonate monooxygenase SsuD/methylene tetrahydromethanopterin reductase-like flavin-dependent oxidoreductase (luciferase family)